MNRTTFASRAPGVSSVGMRCGGDHVEQLRLLGGQELVRRRLGDSRRVRAHRASCDQLAAPMAPANPPAIDSTKSRRCMGPNLGVGIRLSITRGFKGFQGSEPSNRSVQGLWGPLETPASLSLAGDVDERSVDHLRPLPERLDAHALVVAVHSREVVGIDRIRIDPVHRDAARAPRRRRRCRPETGTASPRRRELLARRLLERAVEIGVLRRRREPLRPRVVFDDAYLDVESPMTRWRSRTMSSGFAPGMRRALIVASRRPRNDVRRGSRRS